MPSILPRTFSILAAQAAQLIPFILIDLFIIKIIADIFPCYKERNNSFTPFKFLPPLGGDCDSNILFAFSFVNNKMISIINEI
ncbi:hypothetical protein CYK73_09435 [Clostridium perfringens]|nr:hypothetical protein CYK73_09435 [Clostridium perfringens]